MGKIIVTGGAGFIGSHVVDALVAEGHAVHVVDDLSSGHTKDVHPKAKLHVLDIRSKKIPELFEKYRPECVFHLAAQKNLRTSIENPVYDADINILGALNLLESAAKTKVKKFIFSSSGGAIYDESLPVPTKENVNPRPVSPYGIAKLVSEFHLDYFRRTKKLATVSLRYSNVYGPRQDPSGEGGVVAIFCRRLLRRQPLILNGQGKQTRDFISVHDVVRANLKALRRTALEPINIGTGHQTSIKTLATVLMRISGRQVPLQFRARAAGDVLRSAIHPGLALKTLGWKPTTSLELGLAETWNWAAEEMRL